ncbi:hypothetical protein [Reinekea sp. G2M2-21]|uniref:hypothetical protein n=1 Tax=Reinekea sp. G2M2-21 TaxID=2788942 RepID=UPI0018AA725D|nr:hypothetical protein [Reinekea sp. G2M2-21]
MKWVIDFIGDSPFAVLTGGYFLNSSQADWGIGADGTGQNWLGKVIQSEFDTRISGA